MILASRLAARIGTTQPKQTMRADKIALAIDRWVDSAMKRVQRIIDERPPNMAFELAATIRNMIAQSVRIMDAGLGAVARAAHADTVAKIMQTMPTASLGLIVQRRAKIRPANGKLMERKATPDEADQIERMLFPPMEPTTAERIVRAPSAGTSWQARMTQLTRLAAPVDVANLVAGWAASGQPPATLERALRPVVQGVRSTSRRVARTEGQRVANAARMEAYAGMDDVIAGYQIHGTMDSRTRPHHAARNGMIFWKAPPPGQPGLSQCPHPPMESDGTVAHNCRCWLTPVLTVDDDIKNDPAAQQLFTNHEANLIPDPTVYSDWFASTDRTQQRYAVGARRLNAILQSLQPGEVASWAHFINPKTGKLIDHKTLVAETPAARKARIAAVNAMLAERRELVRQVSKFGFVPGSGPAMPGGPVAPVIVPPPAPVPVSTIPQPAYRQPAFFPPVPLMTAAVSASIEYAQKLAAREIARRGKTEANHPTGGPVNIKPILEYISNDISERYDNSKTTKFPYWNILSRMSQQTENKSLTDKSVIHKLIEPNPFVVADDFENNLATVRQSESFQKTMTAIQKKVEKTTATKLLAKLKKKYGIKALEKIGLFYTEQQIENFENVYNIAKIPFEPNENLSQSDIKWQLNKSQREIQEYKDVHHNLASMAVYLDELEDLANNGQPIPKQICVLFPDIAKRSIEKLAEPMKQKLDGIMEMARGIVTPTTRESIHAAIIKPAGNDEIVDVQYISQHRRGAIPNFTQAYKQKTNEALNFVNNVSSISAQNIVISKNANDIVAHYPESHDRAFAACPTHSKNPNSYESNRNAAFIHETDGPEVVVHEIGHIIEDSDKYVNEMVQTFLNYRVGDEQPQSMKSLFPNYNFDQTEMGRKNHFDRHFKSVDAYYVGKEYRSNSEILSMGMQALYEDPVGFFKNDPEYANFVVSVLQYKESKRIADAMAAAKAKPTRGNQ
jgi:SPP1 gp7 family putative phage head morphogenesis protein